MYRVIVAGGKWLCVEVIKALADIDGVAVACVLSLNGSSDRAAVFAKENGIPLVTRQKDVTGFYDLLVAAHADHKIKGSTLGRCRNRGIGYHPSLLPLHKGNDSIQQTIKSRDTVTGGTVYMLTEEYDSGPIISQVTVGVPRGATEKSLWRDTLAPLGVEMLKAAVRRFKLAADVTAGTGHA